jgi:hypothetical protein
MLRRFSRRQLLAGAGGVAGNGGVACFGAKQAGDAHPLYTGRFILHGDGGAAAPDNVAQICSSGQRRANPDLCRESDKSPIGRFGSMMR